MGFGKGLFTGVVLGAAGAIGAALLADKLIPDEAAEYTDDDTDDSADEENDSDDE